MEEWVLVPIGEKEAGMAQLVDLVQFEPWPAAVAAAHFSGLLSFLIVPFCFLLPRPIHCAAAAGIEIGGLIPCWFNHTKLVCPLLIKPRRTCTSMGFPRCPHHQYNFLGN